MAQPEVLPDTVSAQECASSASPDVVHKYDLRVFVLCWFGDSRIQRIYVLRRCVKRGTCTLGAGLCVCISLLTL